MFGQVKQGGIEMKSSASIFSQKSIFSILLALAVTLAAGCGSDGDGEAGSSPGLPDVTVPDLLNYDINQSTGAELILTQNPTATVTSTLLTGTFTRSTQAFTLDVQPAAMSVDAGTFLAEQDLDLETGFSTYTLHVTVAAAWVSDGNPTSGEFEIFDDATRKITMRVIADANSSGLPGVEITYWPNGEPDPGAPVTEYTWEQLDGLLEEPLAESYAQIASFAYSLLRFMYEQGGLVILALEFIGENDVLLEETGPIVETCDTFPRASVPAVPNPGTSTFSWSDANSDNSVGPGDSFFVDFSNCWDDDETDSIDTLYHGTVELANYTEVVTDGVITRVGFEPSGGPGGVVFTSLGITETEDDGASIIVFDNETITLAGRFSIVFTSP
jgi:hypothetical protein